MLEDERAKKRLGGQIFTSEKAKVVDVLVDVMPQIREFVGGMIPTRSQPVNGNGSSDQPEPAAAIGTSPASAIMA